VAWDTLLEPHGSCDGSGRTFEATKNNLELSGFYSFTLEGYDDVHPPQLQEQKIDFTHTVAIFWSPLPTSWQIWHPRWPRYDFSAGLSTT